MSQQGPLPYLQVGGVEVANGARTYEYLRNGLAASMQGHFELSPSSPCGVLYRVDGSGCAPATFVSPAADPAPWYDPDEPGSESFLGVVLLDLGGYDSTLTRTVTNKISGLGGGTPSKQQRVPRTWTFRAALISADDSGAEYGLRWLTSVLQEPECQGCDTTSIIVRLVCPPDDCSEEELGEWFSYGAVLTAGPKETDSNSPGSTPDVLGQCRDVVIVEFTITAGNPFLYKRPQATDVTDQEIDNGDGTCDDICTYLFGHGVPYCSSVDAPTRNGQAVGAIFTMVTEAEGMGGFEMAAYRSCDSTLDPLATLRISGVPPYSELVVDSAKRTITLTTTDPDTGEVTVVDGTYLVELNPELSIEWLDSENCNGVGCFCVYSVGQCGGSAGLVTLQTQLREA